MDPFANVHQELATLRSKNELHVATFSGGCFWCLEGPFEALEGVVSCITGFAGGKEVDPTYRQVVEGETGHREAAQVFYQPEKVSYQQLLDTFWLQIDPTDPDGQFADRGEHYRTAIFYHTPEQKSLAEASLQKLDVSGMYEKKIVTSILPYTTFFPAEDYHQNFYQQSSEYYQQYKKGSGRQDYIEAMEAKFKRKE